MAIPGNANLLLLQSAAGAPTGYTIERSLRFNSADSAYLSRTPGSAGNRKTWTWAGWVKRSKLGAGGSIFGCTPAGGTDTTYLILQFSDNDQLELEYWTSKFRQTTQVFRDVSAWFHVVVAFDTTLSTAADRVKLYINGSQVTSFAISNTPTQNTDYAINSTTSHNIGSAQSYSTRYLNGYLADVYFIDGLAHDPTDFGEFDDNGIWQPIAYTGSYGTNGFHLNFADNSSAAALGYDAAGNNDWTVNNISVLGSVASPNWSANLTSSTGLFASGYPAADAFDGNTGTGAATSTGGGLSVNLTWTNTKYNSGNPTLRVYTYQAYKITVDGVTKNADGGGPNSIGWVDCGTITGGFSTVVVYGYSGTNSGSYIAAIEVNGQVLVGPSVAAGNDSLRDSPTNGDTANDTGAGGQVSGNYATLNPLKKGGSITLSNGNLDLVSSGSHGQAFSTIGVSSGKWYWEYTTTSTYAAVGIAEDYSAVINAPMGDDPGSWGYVSNGTSSTKQAYPPASHTSYGSPLAVGDVLGTALDLDNGTLTFYKNGSSMGTAYTGLDTSLTYFAIAGDSTSAGNPNGSINFGQRAFAYPVSGYKALCTANLPTPTIEDGSTAMDVVTYTGNGSSQTISGLEFSPDLVWIKARSQGTDWHALFNTIVGATKRLFSNSNAAEATNAQTLTAFNSDGFSVGNTSEVNGGSTTYVAWTWDGGSSTVSNTQGSITSSVRANPTAGFSIVTYTGNGSTGTVGHGLGVAPAMYITKNRSSSTWDWNVYHVGLTSASYVISLNKSDAQRSEPTTWNATSPTSTVFSIGSAQSNNSGSNYVAYCFAPVAGYSAFGSYTGTGSATDSPFIYTGFLTKFVLIKRYDSGSSNDWYIFDAVRNTYNAVNSGLFPSLNIQEYTQTSYDQDFVSNGFKLRNTNAALNASGGTYIYYAVAENPFKYSRAR